MIFMSYLGLIFSRNDFDFQISLYVFGFFIYKKKVFIFSGLKKKNCIRCLLEINITVIFIFFTNLSTHLVMHWILRKIGVIRVLINLEKLTELNLVMLPFLMC